MKDTKISITQEMLQKTLDALDIAAYTFDKDRRIIFANKVAQIKLNIHGPQSPIGAAETEHFDEHRYYDEEGNLLHYPKGSAVEKALEGQETRGLLLEHRTHKKHEWICVSCVPILDEDGKFSYGILWYEDISDRKSRDDKLKFLLASSNILSLTAEFEERLREKAKLTVPSLADWCGIEIVDIDGSVKRHVLVHRDPSKIKWMDEFEKKYPPPPGTETLAQRVIRTGEAEFVPLITGEMIDQSEDLTQEHRNDIKSLQLVSLMVFPIGNKSKNFGALSLAYAESGRMYTQDDFAFFSEFATHLSILLENARLYDEIILRDNTKDNFLASLSHELRNPLAPIKSSLELLKIQNKDLNLSEEIKIIDHQFNHIARLLNDLLNAARYIRGKIKLESEIINLNDIVKRSVRTMQTIAEASDLILKIDDEATESLLIQGDETRLEQALTNLLSNAIKFSNQGDSIIVKIQNFDDKALVKVIDSGAGITTEEMQHIFEPYYQGERVQEGNSGLGVGLRLVYEIMRLHGGSVSAKSDGPQLGSEFTIQLPCYKEDSIKSPVETTNTEYILEKKKILVIDDNILATDGLVRLLKALGQDAHGLYSGESALTYLTHNSDIDLMFVDIGMPIMNGYELVKRIRKSIKSKFPIIALTGYGFEQDKKKALASGFTTHITKPVSMQQLRTILTEYTE